MNKFKVFPQGTKTAKAHLTGAALPGLGMIPGPGKVGAVTGVDSGGNPVSFDSTVVLTATSDTPTIVTVTVSGQSVSAVPVGPIGSAIVTLTETFADGTPPISDTVVCTVSAGPAGGLVVTWTPA